MRVRKDGKTDLCFSIYLNNFIVSNFKKLKIPDAKFKLMMVNC